MKLATYKDGSRDGQLVVVSRDLSTAHYATGIASYIVERVSGQRFEDYARQHILQPLEKANKIRLKADFNDTALLGQGKEMVEKLGNLIAIFENPALDFSANRAEGDDILGRGAILCANEPLFEGFAKIIRNV